ncbi:23S rRNA (guanosine(2251)-2'-O)-methyltransferase [Yersinia enterocolitica]|nr:23S rRNA (guanosine(2251)-2'-O)-methyltransferase [Yersinia enterocolitica]
MDGGEKRAGAGRDSRWLDKVNGCQRELRIAVIFRASAGFHKGAAAPFGGWFIGG